MTSILTITDYKGLRNWLRGVTNQPTLQIDDNRDCAIKTTPADGFHYNEPQVDRLGYFCKVDGELCFCDDFLAEDSGKLITVPAQYAVLA